MFKNSGALHDMERTSDPKPSVFQLYICWQFCRMLKNLSRVTVRSFVKFSYKNKLSLNVVYLRNGSFARQLT